MQPNDSHQSTEQVAERERAAEARVTPRGNPEPDRGSVDKGKEQLAKVSGN